MTRRLSRRAALRAGGTALLPVVAGCAGDSNSQPTSIRTTTPDATTTTPPTTSTTSPGDGDLPEQAVWSYDLGGKTRFGPALRHGALYVGREDGRLAALDPDSGEERWTTDAGAGFFGGIGGHGVAPAVVDGTIYFVSGAQAGIAGEDFRAVALDEATGDTLWTTSLDQSSFLTLLGVHDGGVLVATSDDNLEQTGETLASLAADSGDQQWTAEVGDPSSAGVGAGGVYVETFTSLQAVALDGGERRWAKTGRVADSVDVATDTVVTSLRRGDRTYRLLGFDPVSGEELWQGPQWTVTSHATTSDGVVYAGGEQIGAYDAASGSERWSIRGNGFVLEPPIAGRLFARLESGIHARDPANGDLLWGTNATLDSHLALGESLVSYVASPEDPAVPPTLVARHADDGTAAFGVTFESGARLTDPVVSGDAAFVATESGVVYAFRT